MSSDKELKTQARELAALLEQLGLKINKITPAPGDKPSYESTPVEYADIGKLNILKDKLAELDVHSEVNKDATPKLKILRNFKKLEELNVVHVLPSWLDRTGKTTWGLGPYETKPEGSLKR